jgi:hypothetical protein
MMHNKYFIVKSIYNIFSLTIFLSILFYYLNGETREFKKSASQEHGSPVDDSDNCGCHLPPQQSNGVGCQNVRY